MASQSESKGRLIFAPIMLIGGIVIFMFASYPKLQKARATKSWEQVEGKVTDVWIIAHKKGHSMVNQNNPERYRGKEGVKFRLGLTYTYTVDQIYTSRSQYLLQSKTDGYKKYSIVEFKRNHYLSNPDVTVYYNPDNPGESLLRTGVKAVDWLMLVSPLLAVFIGLALLVGLLKNSLRKKD